MQLTDWPGRLGSFQNRGFAPNGRRPTPLALSKFDFAALRLRNHGGIGCADCMPPPLLGASRRYATDLPSNS